MWGGTQMIPAVLIIEDEIATREMYISFIKATGYAVQIDCSPSLEHAMDSHGERLLGSGYDIIFCDHHNDGMDSTAVYRTLKSMSCLPKQFYVVTGDNRVRTVAGMTGIIYKPNFHELREAMIRRLTQAQNLAAKAKLTAA